MFGTGGMCIFAGMVMKTNVLELHNIFACISFGLVEKCIYYKLRILARKGKVPLTLQNIKPKAAHFTAYMSKYTFKFESNCIQ